MQQFLESVNDQGQEENRKSETKRKPGALKKIKNEVSAKNTAKLQRRVFAREKRIKNLEEALSGTGSMECLLNSKSG